MIYSAPQYRGSELLELSISLNISIVYQIYIYCRICRRCESSVFLSAIGSVLFYVDLSEMNTVEFPVCAREPFPKL